MGAWDVMRGAIAEHFFEESSRTAGRATDSALEALESAGYQIVPVEPTEAMLKAVRDLLDVPDKDANGCDNESRAFYGAMLAAARES